MRTARLLILALLCHPACTDTSAGDTGQLRNWRVAQQVGARCDKDEALPNTGIIPLEQDEGGGGTASPLLLLLALWPRLWRRSTPRS